MQTPDDFEKQLGAIPLRQAPKEWRDAILSEGRKAVPLAKAAAPWRRTLAAWLWPDRFVWKALAAGWGIIGLLVLGSHLETPALNQYANGAPPPFDAAQFQREQKAMMAEFYLNPASPPPLPPSPGQPRSGLETPPFGKVLRSTISGSII